MGTEEKGEEEDEVGMGSVNVVATTDDSHINMADRVTFRHCAVSFSGIRFQITQAPKFAEHLQPLQGQPCLTSLVWQAICMKIMFHFPMNDVEESTGRRLWHSQPRLPYLGE